MTSWKTNTDIKAQPSFQMWALAPNIRHSHPNLARQDAACSTDNQPQTFHAAELLRLLTQLHCIYFPAACWVQNLWQHSHTQDPSSRSNSLKIMQAKLKRGISFQRQEWIPDVMPQTNCFHTWLGFCRTCTHYKTILLSPLQAAAYNMQQSLRQN